MRIKNYFSYIQACKLFIPLDLIVPLMAILIVKATDHLRAQCKDRR